MSEENNNLNSHKTLIWDISTRLFHWLLVTLIIFQWLTGDILEDWINWHVTGGYVLLGLILFRIVWGFAGPIYARFSQFIYGPAKTLNYAKTLGDKDSPHYAGHNPMGGLMVVFMLILLLLQAISGLFITDDIFTSGPYHSAVSDFWQNLFTTIHHQSFELLKIIIVLHLAAIIFYRVYKGQHLVTAMWHGKKEIKAEPIKEHMWLRAIIVALLVAGLVYLVVEVLPPEAEDDFYSF